MKTSTNRSDERFITKWDLAKHLSVSLRTITRLMADHAIPFIRIGVAVRFRLSEVLESLTDHPRGLHRPRSKEKPTSQLGSESSLTSTRDLNHRMTEVGR